MCLWIFSIVVIVNVYRCSLIELETETHWKIEIFCVDFGYSIIILSFHRHFLLSHGQSISECHYSTFDWSPAQVSVGTSVSSESPFSMAHSEWYMQNGFDHSAVNVYSEYKLVRQLMRRLNCVIFYRPGIATSTNTNIHNLISNELIHRLSPTSLFPSLSFSSSLFLFFCFSVFLFFSFSTSLFVLPWLIRVFRNKTTNRKEIKKLSQHDTTFYISMTHK